MRDSDLDVAGVLSELKKRYGSTVTYQRFWKRLIAAKIPGAYRYGRQWFIPRVNLPAVAKLFDLDRAA